MPAWKDFFSIVAQDSQEAPERQAAADRLRNLATMHTEGSDETLQCTVVSVAGLIACVAYADRQLAPEELKKAQQALSRIPGLSAQGVTAVCALLEQDIEDLTALGDQVFVRELKELTTHEARYELLEVLVDVAAVDGEVSLIEANYLRRLTTMLGLSQANYNSLQAKHRDKLSTIKSS